MAAAEPGFFGRLARTVMRHPKRVALGLALMTALALFAASRIVIKTNILEMLPPDHPTTASIRQLNEEEGGANILMIGVHGEDGDALDHFMKALSGKLAAHPDVEYALYDIEPQLAWRIGLLQLTPDELATIRDRVRGAVALGAAATNPFVASRLLDLGAMTERLGSSETTAVSGKDDGVARLMVRPTGSAYDPKFNRPFMKMVEATIDELDPESQGLRVVWLGGAYRHAVEDLEGIVHDLSWTAVASMSLVLLLVSIAFRDPRAVFLIFGPLLFSTLWTFGWAGLVVGTLTTFTSYFAAILIGLGVDFSIHLYSRYREERTRGGTLEDAVVRAWDHAGPPCATAALTSAGGFCALWVAGFDGFRQLGTMLAGGVLFCLTGALVVLPLLIRWREKRPVAIPLRRFRFPKRTRPPTYRLAPTGLLLVALVTIAAGFTLPKIGFEYDLSMMRRRGLAFDQLGELERQVAQDSYAPVVVSYADADRLAQDYQRLTGAMAAGELPEIARILSIHTAIPVDQAERLTILRELAELAKHENLKYLPVVAQQNLTRVADADLSEMQASDLPAGMQHLLGANEGRHRMLLLPSGNMWDLRENLTMSEALDEWIPDQPAAGEFLASAMLYEMVRGDTPKVAGVALLLVFFMTWFDLRSLSRATGAVLALATGMCWAGAGLVLFRIDLSLVNFVGIPILMGIGVDVVIHLLHRMYEEGPGRIRTALATTGWAAGLSATTTVLSFASLSLASSQGVRSLGLLIVLGLTLVTTAAFVVVPFGWMTAWKVRGELPDGVTEDGEPVFAHTRPPKRQQQDGA